MQDIWFYTKLGLDHVLDPNAYDHILFLIALAVPFTFKSWKKVLVLATIFTVAHCISLALSAYEMVELYVGLVEFLIPVTIAMTAVFNLLYIRTQNDEGNLVFHGLATGFFGLIHGFGFSNYFKMLMAGENEKLSPLLGFALGIEISQVLIVLIVLAVAFLIASFTKIKQAHFTATVSILIILTTIPMLVKTFPF